MNDNIINLFFLAITPGIALFILIYKLDRYDKEPFKLLLKLFIYGMIIAVPVIFFERILLRFNIFPSLASAFYLSFIVAGFTEEFFKRYIVIVLAFKQRHYTEKFDGIVYAVVTSLGFATIENILYVVFGYQSYRVGITRALISVPGHMLFAITMGYYLSLSKFATKKKTASYYFTISLIVPIILHGLFNFIITLEAYTILPIFLLFMIYLYVINIKRLNLFYSEKQKLHLETEKK